MTATVSYTSRDFNEIQKNLERVNAMMSIHAMDHLPTPVPEDE